MPPKLTHFLCLPLVTTTSLPQLTSSLARLSADKAVQQHSTAHGRLRRPGRPSKTQPPNSDTDPEDGNSKQSVVQEAYLPRKAIRPVGTLHLTLGVMNLVDNDNITAAVRFLQSLDVAGLFSHDGKDFDKDMTDKERQHAWLEEVVESASPTKTSVHENKSTTIDSNDAPLNILLKGLSTFSNPTRARILFAEPHDPSNRLLPFCQRLQDEFVKAGYVIEDDRELKLHATIVNTIYAKTGRGRGKSNLEFDSRDLIERYQDQVWAEVEISKVAICEMGAKEDKDGQVRYVEIAAVPIRR